MDAHECLEADVTMKSFSNVPETTLEMPMGNYDELQPPTSPKPAPMLVLYASFRNYAPALGLGGESILFSSLSRSQIFSPSAATTLCALVNRLCWYPACAVFLLLSTALLHKLRRYPRSFVWEALHPARSNLLFTPIMAISFLLAGLPDELRPVESHLLVHPGAVSDPSPYLAVLWAIWGVALVSQVILSVWTYSRWLASDAEFTSHTMLGRQYPRTALDAQGGQTADLHKTFTYPDFHRGYEPQLTHLYAMVVWHLLSISSSSILLPPTFSLATFHVGLFYLLYLTFLIFQHGSRLLADGAYPESFRKQQRSFLVLLMAPWAAAGSAYVGAMGGQTGEGGGMPQV
ncbi:hypothetical protein HDU93_000801 [Gonapodya sp. JEL0774]|nr:hypothetical protein HDU93_000801 [Gonapodya sp. JEL0774]